jgi:hypothetical protein
MGHRAVPGVDTVELSEWCAQLHLHELELLDSCGNLSLNRDSPVTMTGTPHAQPGRVTVRRDRKSMKSVFHETKSDTPSRALQHRNEQPS